MSQDEGPYRDDHAAALERADALERELEQAKQERDRLQTEVDQIRQVQIEDRSRLGKLGRRARKERRQLARRESTLRKPPSDHPGLMMAGMLGGAAIIAIAGAIPALLVVVLAIIAGTVIYALSVDGRQKRGDAKQGQLEDKRDDNDRRR